MNCIHNNKMTLEKRFEMVNYVEAALQQTAAELHDQQKNKVVKNKQKSCTR